MATDFWASSHFKRWTVDREYIWRAQAEDRHYVDDPDHLALLDIFFANLLSQVGSKLNLRQRVIATATVFFRRFHLKNAYCEIDPYIVIAACLYVAAKAEEQPVHIKTVVNEARAVFSAYGIKHFPTDNAKLAEMEFYLVDDLECDLVVFHPYRTLMALVNDVQAAEQEKKKESGKERESRKRRESELEAGELGAGTDDGRRFWGTGEGRLNLITSAIQNAWFLVNDTYRSDICILYPPHLIAIAALYITCVLNVSIRQAHFEYLSKQEGSTASQTRRSLRQSNNNNNNTSESASVSDNAPSAAIKCPPQDFVGFFAGLNVNMRLIASIAQEMISFYALCERYKDDYNAMPSASSSSTSTRTHTHTHSNANVNVWSRSAQAQGMGSRSTSHGSASAGASTPGDGDGESRGTPPGMVGGDVDSKLLVQIAHKMRTAREVDIAHPPTGRPVAVSRMLERTQG